MSSFASITNQLEDHSNILSCQVNVHLFTYNFRIIMSSFATIIKYHMKLIEIFYILLLPFTPISKASWPEILQLEITT